MASEQMNAVLYERFGAADDVLRWGRRPRPRPGRGEVLVRVRACALNPKDVLVRKGKFRLMSGRRFPRTPGYDVAGEVARLGPGVHDLREGEQVFGMIQSWDAGGCAEYAILKREELAPSPTGSSMEEAAAVPLAALTALQALRDNLHLLPGQRVCLNGASGGVGLFAVQIAKIMGARVTAVCSGRNRDLVLEMGADEMINYREEDVGARQDYYDAFFDIFGSWPWEKAKGVLREGGRYVTAIPRPQSALRELGGKLGIWDRARLVVVQSNTADLEVLRGWIEAGQLTPRVDRVFSMRESAQAHAYIETRRARGKVVVVP